MLRSGSVFQVGARLQGAKRGFSKVQALGLPADGGRHHAPEIHDPDKLNASSTSAGLPLYTRIATTAALPTHGAYAMSTSRMA